MTNVKVQMTNKIQSLNVKLLEFELLHSFDIWILKFGFKKLFPQLLHGLFPEGEIHHLGTGHLL